MAYIRLSVRAGLVVSADSSFGSYLIVTVTTTATTALACSSSASMLEHTLIQSSIGFLIFLESIRRGEGYCFRFNHFQIRV